MYRGVGTVKYVICIKDDGSPRGEVEFSQGVDVNDE